MHDTTAPGKPTGDRVVLGIHSHVDPNTEGSFNQFVDGHAWISVTRNGQTETYGLWPDRKLPRQADTSKIELRACWWRYSTGVSPPSESWGRASL